MEGDAVLLGSDGNVLLDDDGNVRLHGYGADPCCQDIEPGEPCSFCGDMTPHQYRVIMPSVPAPCCALDYETLGGWRSYVNEWVGTTTFTLVQDEHNPCYYTHSSDDPRVASYECTWYYRADDPITPCTLNCTPSVPIPGSGGWLKLEEAEYGQVRVKLHIACGGTVCWISCDKVIASCVTPFSAPNLSYEPCVLGSPFPPLEEGQAPLDPTHVMVIPS
jgi:hypothetical protein